MFITDYTVRSYAFKDVHRITSHSQDTRLGTQSITPYGIVSVDVDDVLPKERSDDMRPKRIISSGEKRNMRNL